MERCARKPQNAAHARRLIDRLRLRPLLSVTRGRPAPDIDAFADLAARFSVVVAELGDDLSEIDLNPVIVHDDGCRIVDALIIPATPVTPAREQPPARKAS